MGKVSVGLSMSLDSFIAGPNDGPKQPLGEGSRLVQLTPPGSACSIHLNTAIPGPQPGSLQGLTLVVADIEAARDELVGRGLEASPVQHLDGGAWVEGRGGDWNSFVFFSDPDGNGWVLQERPASGQGQSEGG